MANPLVVGAVSIAVAAIVIGSVALPILSSVNITAWSSINQTIFPFVSTFLILALLLGAIYISGMM